jgi:guanylate kinase
MSACIIISAPSGAGKTTVTKKIVELYKSYEISISATTRKPRPSESNGIEYFFLSNKEFDQKINNNDFVEYAEVFNNRYGTLKSVVDEALIKNKNVLFDIDWQGARKIRESYKNSISIFLMPPSVEELEKRIRFRNQDSEDEINFRISKAMEDVSHIEEYEHKIVNHTIEKTAEEINNIVKSIVFK